LGKIFHFLRAGLQVGCRHFGRRGDLWVIPWVSLRPLRKSFATFAVKSFEAQSRKENPEWIMLAFQ